MTPAQRVRRALSWPNPAGVLISLAGASLVFSGAVALHGGFEIESTTPSPAQAAPAPDADAAPDTDAATAATTATATRTVTDKEASPAASTVPTAERPVSAQGGTAKALAPSASAIPSPSATTAPTLAATVVVAGAAPSSPIQRLLVAGNTATDRGAAPSITDPASLLVVVNKQRPLSPLDYMPADLVSPNVATGSGEPAQLRKEASDAVERMFAAAGRDGVAITIMSSFRSYSTQVSLYGSYVAQKGRAEADTSSARPGFSEHQSGLALDIGDPVAGPACEFTYCMADSAAGKWVAAHGADYGFVVRYQMGMEGTTGYLAEPWHLRFVGIPVAKDIAARGFKSYEQYLGIPGAPTYK